jgi:hypothetical protein
MKKLTLIVYLLLYCASSFGVAIRQFYCCSRLESTLLLLSSVEKDNSRSKDDKKGCCDTRFQSFKVKDYHAPAANVNAPTLFAVDLHLLYLVSIFSGMAAPKATAPSIHSPPINRTVSLCVINSVFRI